MYCPLIKTFSETEEILNNYLNNINMLLRKDGLYYMYLPNSQLKTEHPQFIFELQTIMDVLKTNFLNLISLEC